MKNCKYFRYRIIRKINGPKGNTTNLRLRPIVSKTISVKTETLRVTMTNLVAEIGGILGLFVGFSFLMVKDQLVNVITYFLNKI